MNELQAQSLVVKAVKSAGGTGWKASNRFLAGIPDLVLCLPRQAIGIWEVKIDDKPKRDNYIALKITELQNSTLRDLDNAGGYCGVISFLRDDIKLFMAVFHYNILRYEDAWTEKYRVGTLGYTELKRGMREEIVVDLLEKAYGQRV